MMKVAAVREAVNANLDEEAVSYMGGIVHCDACSDGQQHLSLK